MGDRWQDGFSDAGGAANPRLGTRFDATGRFLPEAGNTVVAQVTPGSPTEAALADLCHGLRALPWADRFAFTAPESWHMTVFEGVSQTRRQADFWPEGLALDLGIDAMTEAMAARLADLAALPGFAMRVVEVTPHGLRLTGASPQDERIVRGWRDALARALRLLVPGHDAYGFHTTLAYHIRWPPAEALGPYEAALARLTEAFIARVPVLHLERPAFCRFADMNAFPAVLAL